MKRSKKILGLIIFSAVFIVVILLVVNKSRTTTPETPSETGGKRYSDDRIPYVERPTEEYFIPDSDTLETSEVETANFLKLADKISKYGDAVFYQDENYSMIYHSESDQFLISIVAPTFSLNRVQAERKLVELLEISESDACKLNVVITTPRFANPREAGKNYGLSFCGGTN